MSKKRLLVDTVAIIDCHKFSCWNAVLSRFEVETVEECYRECCRGGRSPDHVQFDPALLLSQFAQPPHVVTEKMRATLALKTFNMRMDAGERDLMAYAITQRPYDFILCGPDAALVRAAIYTSLESRVVSLEEVAKQAGLRVKDLDEKNTAGWLSRTRTRILLEQG